MTRVLFRIFKTIKGVASLFSCCLLMLKQKFRIEKGEQKDKPKDLPKMKKRQNTAKHYLFLT